MAEHHDHYLTLPLRPAEGVISHADSSGCQNHCERIRADHPPGLGCTRLSRGSPVLAISRP
jgi:hypothetical protein